MPPAVGASHLWGRRHPNGSPPSHSRPIRSPPRVALERPLALRRNLDELELGECVLRSAGRIDSSPWTTRYTVASRDFRLRRNLAVAQTRGPSARAGSREKSSAGSLFGRSASRLAFRREAEHRRQMHAALCVI